VNLQFQLDDLRAFCLGISPAYLNKRVAILEKGRRRSVSRCFTAPRGALP
jgi:hypothetical protein